jgi:hypothetical protein
MPDGAAAISAATAKETAHANEKSERAVFIVLLSR